MTAGRNDTRHDRNARKPMSTPLNGTVQNIPMLTVTDRQHHDDTQTHDTEHERRHDIRHGQHERDGQHAEPDHRQRPADVADTAADRPHPVAICGIRCHQNSLPCSCLALPFLAPCGSALAPGTPVARAPEGRGGFDAACRGAAVDGIGGAEDAADAAPSGTACTGDAADGAGDSG